MLDSKSGWRCLCSRLRPCHGDPAQRPTPARRTRPPPASRPRAPSSSQARPTTATAETTPTRTRPTTTLHAPPSLGPGNRETTTVDALPSARRSSLPTRRMAMARDHPPPHSRSHSRPTPGTQTPSPVAPLVAAASTPSAWCPAQQQRTPAHASPVDQSQTPSPSRNPHSTPRTHLIARPRDRCPAQPFIAYLPPQPWQTEQAHRYPGPAQQPPYSEVHSSPPPPDQPAYGPHQTYRLVSGLAPALPAICHSHPCPFRKRQSRAPV